MTALIVAFASMWMGQATEPGKCASENLTMGLREYANFRWCMEGPGNIASAPAYPCSCPSGSVACWAVWDCNKDYDVDLEDFAAFQRARLKG